MNPNTQQNPLTALLGVLGNYFTKPSVQSPVPGKTFGTPFQENLGAVDKAIASKIPPPPGVKPTIPKPTPTMAQVAPSMPQVTPQVTKTPVMPQATQTPQQPTPTVAIPGFKTAEAPHDYANLITQAAQQNGIPAAVLASLLFSEHGFSRDPGWNKNPDGSWDRGPAQINSAAHPEITDAQALDPNFAIPWAAKVLASHINNLGLQRGIAAYNVGEGGATQDTPDRIGPKGHAYLDKIKAGIDPQVAAQLGL